LIRSLIRFAEPAQDDAERVVHGRARLLGARLVRVAQPRHDEAEIAANLRLGLDLE